MSKIPATLLIFVCFCFETLAWNGSGHMVVSQIAYNHLDPAVKAKCDAVIAVPLTYGSSGNNTFVTAACWADDYKSQLGTANWHYIDLPFSLDGTSTNGVVPESYDVVLAINMCISNLLNNSSAPTNQATCLRYLLHFVGDIHQPLHASTAVWASRLTGDAGGNGFNITGQWSNLHSLWDSGGGYVSNSWSRPLSASDQNALNAKVATAEADYPYTPHLGIPDPMDWAEEGWNVAQTVSYVDITRGTTPSAAYLNSATATSEQRLALGGHRLADLLNSLFSTNAVKLACSPMTNNAFGFSWNSISGRTYKVQWKAAFNDSWTDRTNITATGSVTSFVEPVGQTQRLYRVAQ